MKLKLLRKAFSFIVRVVSFVLILSLIFVLYLGYFGLPPSLINSKLELFQSELDMRIEMDEVVFRSDGWVIRSLKLSSSNPDQLTPLIFIDRIIIDSFNPFRALQKSVPLPLECREIVFTSHSKSYGNEERLPLQIDLLRTKLIVKNNQLSFESGEVISNESSFLFSGDINSSLLNVPSTNVELPAKLAMIIHTIDSAPKSMNGVVEFSMIDSDWKKWNVRSSVILNSMRLFGSDFDVVKLQIEVADQQIRVEQLEAIQADTSIHLTGSYQYNDQLVELSGVGDIDLCSFDFTSKLSDMWDTRGLLINSIPSYSFTLGPAHIDEIEESIVFELEAEVAGISELLIDPIKIEGSLKKEISNIHIRNVKVSSFENDSVKLGHADLLFYEDRKALSNQLILNLSIHPELLKELSFLNESIRPLLTRFTSEEPEGLLQVDLIRDVDKYQGSQWKGSICGNNLSYNGVYFDQLKSDFIWQNLHLILSNFRGTHEGRYLLGDVKIDFSDSVFDGNLESDFSVKKIQKFLDVESEFIDNSLELMGHPQLLFQGKLKWEPFSDVDFILKMKSDKCRVYNQELENFNCRVVGKNQTILLEQLQGTWLGGSVVLEGTIPYDHSHLHGWMIGVCKLTDISLAQLTKNKVDASLSVNSTFRYDSSRPLVSSMQAEIDLKILGNRLVGLPVLKELSEFVGTVWTPLDLFAIDKLEGDLKWSKSQVEVSQLEMSGPIFAGEFEGLYDFDDGYDAMLQLQFSHDNKWKRMLHLLTKPFLRVLDLNLSGSLESPTWSLRKIDQVIQ